MEWWEMHRYGQLPSNVLPRELNDMTEESLCALMFNVMGYLHEHLKARRG